MKLDCYQVNAFTDKLFGGNPACVVPLQTWLPDQLMLTIAKENAVAETAFFVPGIGGFDLRWFTPEIEMDLCGHATLATAHILKTELGYSEHTLSFQSASGLLNVSINGNQYVLDFPARSPMPATLPAEISEAIDPKPIEVLKSRDYLLVYEKETDIRSIKISRALIDRVNIDPGGIIITAPGDQSDFVSRFFTPQASIFEDPVTGSAHCSLIPYWSKRLSKTNMLALQLSERIGTLYCVDKGERVLIGGNAVTYASGNIRTE